MRGRISLGDVLRVNAALQPEDAETEETIREMLGVEGVQSAPAMPAIAEWKPSETGSAPTVPPSKPAGEARQSTDTRETATTRATGATVLRRVKEAPATPELQRPVWLAKGDALGPASMAVPPPPPPPLFGPPRGRAILTATLATTVEEGDVDIDRVVRTLSERRPLGSLPRRPVPTLRRGVQLLLDIAAGMDPFRPDQTTLRDGLDDVLSDDRLEVLSFAGCPSRGVGPGARHSWRPWEPPPPGTPILAVTDVGIGGDPFDEDRASVGEWLEFAHRVRGDGYVLLALVPYEARRWPAVLTRAMTLLHWSERTTVGEVRRALRRAYGRTR